MNAIDMPDRRATPFSSSNAAAGSSVRAGRRRSVALAGALSLAVLAGAAAAEDIPTTVTVAAPPDTLIIEAVDTIFDDLSGWTNPRFSDAVFSNPEYMNSSESGVFDGTVQVKVKTSEELNELTSPPPNPFEFTVTVTMIEDGDLTLKLKLAYETHYESASTPERDPSLLGPPPTSAELGVRMVLGQLRIFDADEAFLNAGTNPRFTGAVFSEPELYDATAIGVRDRQLWVLFKSAAELRELPSPPDSSFTTTVEVTMANDEGQTATATMTFYASYI